MSYCVTSDCLTSDFLSSDCITTSDISASVHQGSKYLNIELWGSLDLDIFLITVES